MAKRKNYDFSKAGKSTIFNLTKNELLKHSGDNANGTTMSIVKDILVSSKK